MARPTEPGLGRILIGEAAGWFAEVGCVSVLRAGEPAGLACCTLGDFDALLVAAGCSIDAGGGCMSLGMTLDWTLVGADGSKSCVDFGCSRSDRGCVDGSTRGENGVGAGGDFTFSFIGSVLVISLRVSFLFIGRTLVSLAAGSVDGSGSNDCSCADAGFTSAVCSTGVGLKRPSRAAWCVLAGRLLLSVRALVGALGIVVLCLKASSSFIDC